MRGKIKTSQIVWLILGVLACVGLWWFADSTYMTQLGDFVTRNLDSMRDNVLKLTAISTMSSTILTLIPGDVATPLAENLADISDYLIIVFAGLWLQKYLFFSLSGIALKILMPIGILLTVFPQLLNFFKVGPHQIHRLRKMGTRIVSFGTVLFLVVPITLAMTKQLEGNYQATIDRTVQQSEQVQESVNKENKKNENNDKANDQDKQDDKPKDFLGQVGALVTDGVDGVVDATNGVVEATTKSVEQLSGAVTDLPQKMMVTLDNLIESLALMLVVNCIAPIFIFVFLMWLAKQLFGLSLQSDQGMAPIRPMGTFVRKYRKTRLPRTSKAVK